MLFIMFPGLPKQIKPERTESSLGDRFKRQIEQYEIEVLMVADFEVYTL